MGRELVEIGISRLRLPRSVTTTPRRDTLRFETTRCSVCVDLAPQFSGSEAEASAGAEQCRDAKHGEGYGCNGMHQLRRNDASLSPMKTAGTSASIMPSVVPATTSSGVA